ncbi:hypothetical protein AMR72_13885 [Flavobacterium psychrophilum]|nr:hypothetical protein AMR72_13885 [Flavobacterium psychrophilum]AOE53517.1 hypothetical protein ALW18_13875 [Flavobacterium psychrophilum]
MKVVHIGIHYNPSRGGGNLRNSRLIKESAYLTPNDDIYIISYDYKIAFINTIPNVHVYISNNVFKQLYYLIKLCLTNKVDIIHCHNPRLFFLVSLLQFKAKLILELHSFQILSGIKQKMFALTLHKAHKIFVLGKYGRDLLMKNYNICHEKISIIPNGFTVTGSQTYVNNERRIKVVSYIGSFYEWQGVYNFVEAVKIFLKKYNDDNVRFLMVGAGVEFENVKKKITQYNLEAKIILTGHVSPDDIEGYWKDTDIFVIPRPSTQATESTVPLKIMEAFSYGKFIIGSDVKGVSEHISNNYNGLLYSHKDLNMLADKIYISVTDNDLYDNICQNSIRYCKELLSWESVAKLVLENYKE